LKKLARDEHTRAVLSSLLSDRQELLEELLSLTRLGNLINL